jgi:hypothetical protein
MEVFFTNDNLYAIAMRLGTTTYFNLVSLKKDINVLEHGINFYNLGGVNGFSYHVDKRFFVFKSNRKNKLFLYQPVKNQTNEIKHSYQIKQYHNSISGDYLIIKNSDNKYKTIDIKPYLISPQQWKYEFEHYRELNQSYIDKSTLRLVAKKN